MTWMRVWYFLHKFFLCQILAVSNSFDGARAEISFEKRLFSKGTLNCHCLKIQYLLSVRYSIIMANSKDARPKLSIRHKLTHFKVFSEKFPIFCPKRSISPKNIMEIFENSIEKNESFIQVKNIEPDYGV